MTYNENRDLIASLDFDQRGEALAWLLGGIDGLAEAHPTLPPLLKIGLYRISKRKDPLTGEPLEEEEK